MVGITPFSNDTGVYHWSEATGLRQIGFPVGIDDSSLRPFASRDGSKVIAARHIRDVERAWQWDDFDDRTRELVSPNPNLVMLGASADAEVLVGFTNTPEGRRPFRRNISFLAQDEIIDIPEGMLGGEGWSLSADARRMAIGLIAPPRPGEDANEIKAAIWDEDSGMEVLEFDPQLDVKNAVSLRISDDGTATAGILAAAGEPELWAFRHTESGIEIINDAYWRTVYDMTPDGSLITGEIIRNGQAESAVWTQETGTVTFESLLDEAALDVLGGGLFFNRLSVADDGLTFAANYNGRPHLIALPSPSTCWSVVFLVCLNQRRLRRAS
ncbi:MAG: hypothetical protein AAGK04_04675 [Planctomycetota bacterium]